MLQFLLLYRPVRRLFFVVGLCFLCGLLANEKKTPTDSYVILSATLIDGTRNLPIHNSAIIIAKDRIIAVGRKEQIDIPLGAQVIDAKGKWIVPGLIDAHIHFAQSGGLYTRPDVIDLRDTRPYSEEMAWIKQRIPYTLSRYICSGVTSVADLGGPRWTLSLKPKFSQTKNAPRITAAGPLISTFIPTEITIDDPPMVYLGDAKEARLQVNNILKHGADLIKIWFINHDLSQATMQSIKTVIEESHENNSRVVVHATELELARTAVNAGANILAHSILDKPIDDDFIKLLKKKDVTYIPTLQVKGNYREVLAGKKELNTIEKSCGDQEVIATWNELSSSEEEARFSKHKIAALNLRRVANAGIKIAAGSDAGNIGTLHGPALHRELELMVEAGLTPMQALLAATRDAAIVTNAQSEIGTLQPGKYADLLILDADPIKDIRNLAKINMVIKGGEIYGRINR